MEKSFNNEAFNTRALGPYTESLLSFPATPSVCVENTEVLKNVPDGPNVG
jgi:hypothetical protein